MIRGIVNFILVKKNAFCILYNIRMYGNFKKAGNIVYLHSNCKTCRFKDFHCPRNHKL